MSKYIAILTHEQRRERRLQIAEACRSGKQSTQVAKEFGVSTSVVTEACQIHGVVIDKRSTLSTNTYEILAALIYTDESQESLAARFGVTRQRVSLIAVNARKAGIKLLPQ